MSGRTAILVALVATGALSQLGPGRAAAATVASYVFYPNPIAAPGSLTAGQAVNVELVAEDSSGNPVGGATVYLSFNGNPNGAGTASVNGTSLTSTPQAFTATNNGQLAISYATNNPSCVPGGGPCSSTYPTSGNDTITAANAASSPSVAATDSYAYGNTTGQEAYSFDTDPIAAPGSLTTKSTPVTLMFTATKPDGTPDGSANVYVSFASTTNSESSAGPNQTWLQNGNLCTLGFGSGPAPCRTDAAGHIMIDYNVVGSAPPTGANPLPAGGKDVVTVQNALSSPTVTASDAYDYGDATYTMTPTPMAAAGSLSANRSVVVTLVVEDGGGTPTPRATVYLSLTSAKGGSPAGSATATGGTANPSNPQSPSVSSSPSPYTADANGEVLITYTTPSTLPSAATDTISAANAGTEASSSLTDTYTYATATYSFSPSPVAPAGSLAGGQQVPVGLTVRSGGTAQSGATVYLSFSQAPGGGSATAGGKALTATPTAFTADSSGHVAISYTAPASPPSSGADTIKAQDAPASPTGTGADSYAFSKAASQGYWMVGSDGGIFSFGNARFFGSTGGMHLAAPIVDMAEAPDSGGYWLVASDGGIFSFGDAHFYGSTGNIHLAAPIVGMAATPDGGGYWLVASDGGVFTFGDAHFYGSTGNLHLNSPVVGMAASATGGGYWMVASDGGIFAFGDAKFYGSTGNLHLAQPVEGMTSTPDGGGYWMVARDGGIFTFGDAHFYGSTGNITLAAPIVGMAAS